MSKLEDFKDFLGQFGVVVVDSASKEPVAWGYPITGQLGERHFEELKKTAEVAYNHKDKNWVVVTEKLTDQAAIEKFGPITNVEYGPRGGWKSITFGSTRFTSSLFKR